MDISFSPEHEAFRSEVRAFLRRNSKTLDLLALGAWVKFTERYTSAPRLYEKIQGLEPSRSGLKLYRQFLISRGVPHCFYCSNPCVTFPHVDHVVPWCFVAEDKVWNLVLACESCNSRKTSMTPQDRFIEKLTERNASLLQVDESGLPVRVRRDLVEWRGGGLAEHVHILVDRCRADGFGVWAAAQI